MTENPSLFTENSFQNPDEAKNETNTNEKKEPNRHQRQPKHNHNNQKNKNNRTHTPANGLTIDDLRSKTIDDLIAIANDLEIENPQELIRQDLIFAILSSQTTAGGYVLFTGILDIKEGGFGFLRALDGNFSDTSNDSYVSATQIKRFALRNGDIVSGQVRPPSKESEKYYALLKIEAINYLPVNEAKNRPLFDNLTPLYSTEKFTFEYDKDYQGIPYSDINANKGRVFEQDTMFNIFNVEIHPSFFGNS